MAFKDVVREKAGKVYLLGNEAMVRSALEADVKVVSFYPGAPQTEVLDTFEKAVKEYDIRMEIAANEKVALETVAGASMTGLRSLTSMKSVGTNVASDALYSLAYTGVQGGCVLLIADDPYAHSSQSEQDGRWFGHTAYLPTLDPSSTQEAYDMVKAAFDISEKYGTICIVRTTTRVNHQSGLVDVTDMKRTPFVRQKWKENPNQYKTVGAAARDAKIKLMEKMDRMKEDLDNCDLNRIEFFAGKEGSPEDTTLGIIASGVTYNYAIEALERLGLSAHILKIGVINPLPEISISNFIKPLERVVVLEELFPYIETTVLALAKDHNPTVDVVGKRSGHLSEMFEYNIPLVEKAISVSTGTPMPFDHLAHAEKVQNLAEGVIPPRLPVFCAGCPHRATFTALRRAVKNPKNVFFSNDIGCYTMMCLEPYNWSDSLLCMGASLGVGAGVQYSIEEKVIATIGDSTMFHACLPGIANAVHHNDDITIMVLDNSVTAMTGQQSNPASSERAGLGRAVKLDIRKALEGLGVEKILEMNTFTDVKGNVKILEEAIEHDGPSVVISHGECALYHFRNYRHAGGKIVPYYVDNDACEKAHACVYNFMCPAITLDDEGKAEIAEDICVGCGVCSQLCPRGAIKSTATKRGGENKPHTTLEEYAELESKGGV